MYLHYAWKLVEFIWPIGPRIKLRTGNCKWDWTLSFQQSSSPFLVAGCSFNLPTQKWKSKNTCQQRGIPCGSISSLGALGGAWIWIWEFVRLRRRRLEIQGTQIWHRWDWGRKTRISNCPADNRSKVSVEKSQIGFVVINFSRSIFPLMWNKFMDCKKWEYGTGHCSKNLKNPKIHVPAIQKMLMIS